MIPKTNLDYVEFYARKLKDDNALFEQQRMLINSQLQSSSAVFSKMFEGKDFKAEARKYLRSIGKVN